MKKTLTLAGAVVLALGLSSCGGGGDDAAASKSLSGAIMKSQKAGGGAASSLLDLKQKEADCIGQGMVDKIGTDQLIKYKILTKDNQASKDVTAAKMSKGDAATATDVLFGCTDVPGMMNKAMTSSGQVPKEMRACVAKALNDTALRGMFTEVFAGNQDAAKQKLIAPMMKCAQPSAG